MFVMACGDPVLLECTLAALRAAGFMVEADRIIPPVDAQGQQVIAAISADFQSAKLDGSAARKMRP